MKYLPNHLVHKIHIFCPIEINEINGAEIVNFVCQMVLQVFSYKKLTLAVCVVVFIMNSLMKTKGHF